MARSKKRSPRGKTHPSKSAGRTSRDSVPPLPILLGELTVWILLLALWWVHDGAAPDAFRLPKLWFFELLVLLSVLPLAWRLGEVKRIGGAAFWRDLARRPVVALVLPFLVVAAASLLTTEHPLHVRAGLTSLFIAAAGLVAWNLGLPRLSLERLLAGLMFPALALSLFAILQGLGIYRPFQFLQQGTEGRRLGLTSFAGNPGDLGMFLVLPCLVGQVQVYRHWRRSPPSRRWLWLAATLVCILTLALTQTLSALAALAVGTALLWIALLPRRRWLPLLGVLVIGGLVVVLAIAPLRNRVVNKAQQLAAGRLDVVLTGRFDGWQAALQMAREHPLAGVGHSAYRAEFVPTTLALKGDEPPATSRRSRIKRHPMFLNAHSEPLEVLAELGVPGLLALLWGLWVLARHLWPWPRQEEPGSWRPALAWAGCAALLVLSLAQFPFRLALVGLPVVLFLSWVLLSRGSGAKEESP